MRKQTQLVVGALFTASLFLTTGAALVAPEPDKQETRVLHDHDEDPALILAGKHGHDILALDVREVWSSLYGEPMMVFELTLDKGCNVPFNATGPCKGLKETIKFKAGATQHALSWTTDDQVNWTGDFDAFAGPHSIANSTAFKLEGHIRFSRLAVVPGTVLTNWFVEGEADGQAADKMPQGFFAGIPDPLGKAYNAGSYAVRFPDYYSSLDIGPDQIDMSAASGVKTTVDYTVHNPLEVAQQMEVDFLAASGFTVRFIDDAGKSVVRHVFTLEANETKTMQFTVQATQARSTTELTLRLMTELGGIDFDDVRLDVEKPPVTRTATQTQSSTLTTTVTQTNTADTDGEPSEDSPGVGLVVGAVALLGAVAWVRRR